MLCHGPGRAAPVAVSPSPAGGTRCPLQALVLLGGGTLGHCHLSHHATPPILALGSTDGALLCCSLLWDPTSNKDLLWDSQI